MRFRTKFFYITASIIILYSLVRWGGIIYTDYSTSAIFVFAGFLIGALGYLWEWMEYRIQNEQLMNKRMDSLVQEIKSMKE